MDYQENSLLFKALSDPVRIQILDLLASGELCACELLKKLTISQPTLSHHMKILMRCGLVQAHKKGTWIHYKINPEKVNYLHQIIDGIIQSKNKTF